MQAFLIVIEDFLEAYSRDTSKNSSMTIKIMAKSNYCELSVLGPKCPNMEISPQTPKFGNKSEFLVYKDASYCRASNKPSTPTV